MCGVFGIIGKEQVTGSILTGLNQLQHRGQDAAGIFTYNPLNNTHNLIKNPGLVNQVFYPDMFPLPEAYWGIGHLRYATVGNGSIADIQPHCIHKSGLTIAMVHNGNIVNYLPMKNQLMLNQVTFQTTCDTEVVLHLFAEKLSATSCDFNAICHAVNEIYTHIFGAYSILVIIAGKGIVAFRDPWGFRPLIYGKTSDQESHIFSSETGPFFKSRNGVCERCRSG